MTAPTIIDVNQLCFDAVHSQVGKPFTHTMSSEFLGWIENPFASFADFQKHNHQADDKFVNWMIGVKKIKVAG